MIIFLLRLDNFIDCNLWELQYCALQGLGPWSALFDFKAFYLGSRGWTPLWNYGWRMNGWTVVVLTGKYLVFHYKWIYNFSRISIGIVNLVVTHYFYFAAITKSLLSNFILRLAVFMSWAFSCWINLYFQFICLLT